MSDDVNSFLDGDNFPDRPDHPDFWRLSEIVLQFDGRSSEDGPQDSGEVVEGVFETIDVDIDSASYIAVNRISQAVKTLGFVDENFSTAAWLEGFSVGVAFEQRRKEATT